AFQQERAAARTSQPSAAPCRNCECVFGNAYRKPVRDRSHIRSVAKPAEWCAGGLRRRSTTEETRVDDPSGEERLRPMSGASTFCRRVTKPARTFDTVLTSRAASAANFPVNFMKLTTLLCCFWLSLPGLAFAS